MALQQDKVEGQQPGARRAGALAKRATIRDVAREAGVGIGTVSRVLSGRAPVAPATRARVEAAMRKLGYHPSRAAQALSRRRTNTIAVVVPLFTRYFYVEVLRGIEEALDETGYALVIHSVERAADRDRAFGDLVESQRADGALIVSLAPDSALIESLRALHLPAVLIDSSHPALPSVVVDHERAAAEATRHLLRLGHRRVALIDRKEDPFSPEAASARIPGYRRALAAMETGAFADELVPVEVAQPKGPPAVVDADEEPRRVDFDRLPTLPPAFDPQGSVTAANASKISDGAAALVVASADAAARLKRRPIARIVGAAGAAGAPEWFTIQPAAAIRRLLARVGWTLDEVDLFEINEAFASVVLAVTRDLGMGTERVNVHGGAVALGHPIGASGARILTTLLHALRRRGGRRGVAAICLGGGEALALAVERV